MNHAVLKRYLKSRTGSDSRLGRYSSALPSFNPTSRIKPAAFCLWCHIKVCCPWMCWLTLWKTACLSLFQRFRRTQKEAENVSSLLGLSCFIAAAPIQTALTRPQAGRPQLPVTYFDLVLFFFFFFTSGCTSYANVHVSTCAASSPSVWVTITVWSVCLAVVKKACWEVYLGASCIQTCPRIRLSR